MPDINVESSLPIVVGQLDDKVVIFRAVTDHRLRPLAVVGAVARGLAALLELLVTQDRHAEEVPVEGHGGGPVGDLEDEVKCTPFNGHLVIFT